MPDIDTLALPLINTADNNLESKYLFSLCAVKAKNTLINHPCLDVIY
jgi:hypothetical protein